MPAAKSSSSLFAAGPKQTNHAMTAQKTWDMQPRLFYGRARALRCLPEEVVATNHRRPQVRTRYLTDPIKAMPGSRAAGISKASTTAGEMATGRNLPILERIVWSRTIQAAILPGSWDGDRGPSEGNEHFNGAVRDDRR